jgi:anti-anti-sigma factor
MTRTVEDVTSSGAFRGHACATPASDEQLWEMTSAYIAAGLAQGEQVAYYDDGTSDRVIERLLDDEVEIDEPLDRGQLTILPADSTRAALTSPVEDMSRLITEQIGAALSQGWRGLRVTGQFNYSLQRRDGVSVQACDAGLDRAVQGKPASAMCFYDRAHWPDDVIELMRAVHTVEIDAPTIYDDNLLRITTTGPASARVAGEVDHSNRPQVRRLLSTALDEALRAHNAPTDITLDVRSLRFVDVAGAVDLVHAAEEFPSSHRLVLRGVRPRVGRVLDRCGAPFAEQLVVQPWGECPAAEQSSSGWE